MTDSQKQKIARLVAEKVWGWEHNGHPDCAMFYGNIPEDRIHLEVFSWTGFGRTVEDIGSSESVLNYTSAEWVEYISTEGDQKDMHGVVMPYIFIYGIIAGCHIAALDALGIDWRE